MKTKELTGALLDYYVARADGIPAEQLEIRRVQRSTDTHCVRLRAAAPQSKALREAVAVRYSTDWAQGGPLLDKHRPDFYWLWELENDPNPYCVVPYLDGQSQHQPCSGPVDGPSHLVAVCRAVVRAAFGDEVPDVEAV
jgi:hypothetical protein